MADPDPPAPPPRGESAPVRAEVDPLVGQLVSGRYRVERLIARGGMGSIYRAEQVPLGRIVALKVLVPAMLHTEEATELRRRFLREAETCARLRHPNTVTVYDYGTLPLPAVLGREPGDGLYIAMEFVEGRTLWRALKEDGPFPSDRVARIGRQIAKSLREAHAMGVVHRDLKPGNVMLTAELGDDGAEAVKVLDFGVAKLMGETEALTIAGNFVGSPRYASPEQIQEADVDGRSDLYSLGVVLYELLAGVPPFQATDTIRMLMQHVRDAPPPLTEKVPGLSPSLATLIHALLEKRPEDRPANAEAVLDWLRAPDEQGPTLQWVGSPLSRGSSPEPSGGTRTGSSQTSRWLAAGVLGVLGVGALAVLCAGGLWFGLERPDPGGPEPSGLNPVVHADPPLGEPQIGAPVTVDVELTSSPSGAEVREAGALIGRTPLHLQVTLGEPPQVVLHLNGYDDLTTIVDGSTPTQTARLKAKPTLPKPPKPGAERDIRTSR
ncbi:MAG: serine/threonine protein kinase [Myxococcales bacterium]|nr:serine/threonine protein kinase [Myxococcales bacterium]